MTTENNRDNTPQIASASRLIQTHEGASAFPPGSAMPITPQIASAGSGQSGSSFEAVLATLRRY